MSYLKSFLILFALMKIQNQILCIIKHGFLIYFRYLMHFCPLDLFTRLLTFIPIRVNTESIYISCKFDY
jgi:hypothetical protein